MKNIAEPMRFSTSGMTLAGWIARSERRFGRRGKNRFAPRTNKAAFSLIEVTIAMGVAVFAIVGVIGLIPSGLTTLRASVDASAMSRIMRTLASDVRQGTNFSGNVSATNYFDDSGLRTTAAQSIYSAELKELPNMLVPGASTGNTNLKAISVRVARAPGAPANAFTQGSLPSYVLWISKSQ